MSYKVATDGAIRTQTLPSPAKRTTDAPAQPTVRSRIAWNCQDMVAAYNEISAAGKREPQKNINKSLPSRAKRTADATKQPKVHSRIAWKPQDMEAAYNQIPATRKLGPQKSIDKLHSEIGSVQRIWMLGYASREEQRNLVKTNCTLKDGLALIQSSNILNLPLHSKRIPPPHFRNSQTRQVPGVNKSGSYNSVVSIASPTGDNTLWVFKPEHTPDEIRADGDLHSQCARHGYGERPDFSGRNLAAKLLDKMLNWNVMVECVPAQLGDRLGIAMSYAGVRAPTDRRTVKFGGKRANKLKAEYQAAKAKNEAVKAEFAANCATVANLREQAEKASSLINQVEEQIGSLAGSNDAAKAKKLFALLTKAQSMLTSINEQYDLLMTSGAVMKEKEDEVIKFLARHNFLSISFLNTGEAQVLQNNRSRNDPRNGIFGTGDSNQWRFERQSLNLLRKSFFDFMVMNIDAHSGNYSMHETLGLQAFDYDQCFSPKYITRSDLPDYVRHKLDRGVELPPAIDQDGQKSITDLDLKKFAKDAKAYLPQDAIEACVKRIEYLKDYVKTIPHFPTKEFQYNPYESPWYDEFRKNPHNNYIGRDCVPVIHENLDYIYWDYSDS